MGGVDANRQCASSVQAVAVAAHWIMNDDADIMIAAGMETMGRNGPVPPTAIGRRGAGQMARPRAAAPQEEVQYPPDWKKAKLLPAYPPEIPRMGMGNTAEELSRRYNISREDSDAFALTSQQKAIAAQDAGLFK